MKEIKKKVEFFTFYDKTGIEKHLEQMAAEGWLLEKMSAFRWTYRRIEPKKIHFSVSYYATITDFEPEPTEEQQAFNEFCEHSGWKLAASTMQMQVFYNENENPVPIETVPMLEVENIHSSVKKTVLVSYFLMMFFGLMLGASFVDTLISDPVYLLASATKLFTGVWCVIAFAYSLTELITYFVWRKKAKALAEQGVFLETHGHRKLGFAIVVFMLVSVVLYLITLANTGLQFYMTAYVLIFLAGFPLVNGVKSFLKKKKVKADTNKALTFAASFTLAFVLVGALTAVTILGIKNGAFENDLKELPFTVGELCGIDDSDYLKTRGKEDSIILGQYRSSQHPNTYEHSPTMQYTITEVKMPFLYDFVVDTLYHHYDEWKGWNSTYEYVETDATAWGASKAWELYRNGESDKAFLVCYDKYILEISVDWELTAEQKQLIGIRMSACNTNSQTEVTTDVVISLKSDGVYGIMIEYSIDRTRLGGQMASRDPEMTKPLPKEQHTIKFAEQGFGEPYTLDSGKFGILVIVVLENSEEIPLQYLWEWNAAYGEQYHFTLSSDKENGFVLTPSDDVDCTITPWDELPSDFLN